MRILVLGGQGMAGHVITAYLQQDPTLKVWSTFRVDQYSKIHEANTIGVDVRDLNQLASVLNHIRPHVVINAVGILNQAADEQMYDAIFINSLLPHWLEQKGNQDGFRLIHISTDCVFSGADGDYKEEDHKDGTTNYAKTKSLGEVQSPSHLTIRTSIIGPEQKKNGIGLLHWFLQQEGKIYGYRHVYWSGVTTIELARMITWSLQQQHLTGLVHLTGQHKLSKYDLLCLFKEVFNRKTVTIIPETEKKSDKSLVNTRQDFKYVVTEYDRMIRNMKRWMLKHAHLYPYDL
ncbi:dTDP-4-dehydrorhamnose reductase family protein [Caldalkalibacillus salinus]|uniref:dTDP-4-dehydrorhamnose reductase family protein n=1 Tax=Caldalkalibacillus salinus TaxID=2803787 RepID=UPI001923F442|nr:SDR family oxidoreductase [Caldalkalibacillus salinus]